MAWTRMGKSAAMCRTGCVSRRRIVEVSLHTKYALPAYYIIALAEASSNLARYDSVTDCGSKPSRLTRCMRPRALVLVVQRRILIGTYVLSAGYYDAYYLKAQARRLIADGSRSTSDALLTQRPCQQRLLLGVKLTTQAVNFDDVYVPATGRFAGDVGAGRGECRWFATCFTGFGRHDEAKLYRWPVC